MVEAASVVARSLVRLALPLAPVVASDTAPVSRLAEPSVMVAFEAEVVKLDVPPTVRTPLCVRLPVSSVTVRLPPTFDAARVVALLLVRLALPLDPDVASDTAPVSELAEPSVMVAFDAEVVKLDVPGDRQDAALRQVAGLVRHRQAAADGRRRQELSRGCCSGSRCCSRRTW